MDDSDPVIFDHKVDHVPGMLMLHGIAELIERASPEPFEGCAAGSFDLTFTRFVEKDCPTQITVAPAAAPSTWRVELTQSDQVVCAGTAGTLALVGDPNQAAIPVAPPALAEAALVHRQRPENVVVTPLRPRPAGYAVDYAPSEAARTKRFDSIHYPLDVVEATRQFITLLCHTVCGFDLRTRLILNRLVVRTPRAFPRTGTVHLRSAEPRVARRHAGFTIDARCGDAPTATIGWDITAVTPAAYARLRGVAHG